MNSSLSKIYDIRSFHLQSFASFIEQYHHLPPSFPVARLLVGRKRSRRLSRRRLLAVAVQRQSAGRRSILDCFHSLLADCNCNLGLPEESRGGRWGCFHSTVVQQEQREHQYTGRARVLGVVLRRPSQFHGKGSDLAYVDGVRLCN